MKKISVPKIVSFIFLLSFFMFSTLLGQQSPQKSLQIRIGAEGGLAFINPEDINEFIEDWTSSYSVIMMQGTDEIKVGFNGSGYLSLLLQDMIEIRPELGYFIAPKFIMISGGEDLDVILSAFHPGVSASLAPRINKGFRPKFGAGIFQYFGSVNVEPQSGPSTTFTGSKLGFHISAGLELQLFDKLSVTATVLYKHVKIDELKNDDDQVWELVEYDPFSSSRSTVQSKKIGLDLSGVEFRMGANFAL